MENTEKKGIFPRIYNWFVNLTLRGLLGAVLVAFIIIIILMSVSYLPNIIGRVSSSLSAALYSIFVPAEGATMTVNKKIVNSGEDFTISFKKGEVVEGLFTVSYPCDADISLTSVESNGLKKVDCDTRYYLLENETAITLRPTTGESIVRLVVEGAFENNETQKVESVGVARVTVKNDSVSTVVPPTQATTTVTPNTSAPYIPSQPAPIQPVYYGKPDLAVRMLQVGILGSSNIIIPQTQFSYSDMVGIKFEIRNDGDANSGPWYFTAALPSVSTPTFSSNSQISLRPGESIIFTLGFSNLINQNTNLITVTADPQNIVSESVEYNNFVTSTIINQGYNNNYYYNNNYNYNTNNGCYINGIFTYNCGDNNWDWYDNYNYDDLQVSCYAEPDDPETGDRVRWYADAEGGDGDYEYDWSGTNGLDSSTENPTKTYSSRGWKYATVKVESDGDRASATCGVYVND